MVALRCYTISSSSWFQETANRDKFQQDLMEDMAGVLRDDGRNITQESAVGLHIVRLDRNTHLSLYTFI